MSSRTLCAALACAALAVAGCGSGASSGPDAAQQAHTDFMAGCTDGGGAAPVCECIYAELTKRYGAKLPDGYAQNSRAEIEGIARGCAGTPAS